jgi:hypothetical protein
MNERDVWIRGIKIAIAILIFMAIILTGMAIHNRMVALDHKVLTPKDLPPGSQLPSKAFLEEWAKYAALRDEIRAIQEHDGLTAKTDQLNGMAQRLQTQIPSGFVWDEDALCFKPQVVLQKAPDQKK